MVQILPRPPSRFESTFNAFNQGLGRALEGGADLKKAFGERETRDTLAERFGEEFKGIKNPDIQKLMLQGALQGEQQEAKRQATADEIEKNYPIIEKRFGKEAADLYKAFNQGSQTELVKSLLKLEARNKGLTDQLGPIEDFEQEPSFDLQESSGNENLKNKEDKKRIFADLQKELAKQDIGTLPEEREARGKQRFTSGLKEYQEASEKLKTLNDDKIRFDILEDLNKSKKLPKNLGRINVDKEGNLRLPFLASEEAQRYVKTLNEFSAGAKGTFGARVTNFDLTQYMKRYPTLLNSEEGRNQLLQQMKLVNQLNSVYYKNLKKVYDKAGGVRKIDSDRAISFAEKLTEPTLDTLSKKFKQIGQFSSKPNASEFKGKRIRDKKTGEIFVSDGENWIPAE